MLLRLAETMLSQVRQAKMSTELIVQIIEEVDNRCLAVDGPVTKTRLEMTDEEMCEIYEAALLADMQLTNLRKGLSDLS